MRRRVPARYRSCGARRRLLPVGGPPWAVDVVRRVPRLLLAYHRGEDPRCELDHGRDKPDEAVTQADPGGQLMCERHRTGEVEA